MDGHDCGIVHGLDQGAADVCALTPHLPDGLTSYETKAILVCCVLCVSVCACAGSSTAPYCGCVGAPSDDVQSHGHIQPQVGRRIAFVAQWGFDDVNAPTSHPLARKHLEEHGEINATLTANGQAVCELGCDSAEGDSAAETGDKVATLRPPR